MSQVLIFPPEELSLITEPEPETPITKAFKLTHDELTKMGARWLRNQGYMAFRETGGVTFGNSSCTEIADVIAWRTSGASCLIECKVSKADYKADFQKDFRKHEDLGMGVLRYYLCPAGLLKPENVPGKWGLLWAYETRVCMKKRGEPFDTVKAALAEKKVLCALLYRLENEQKELRERLGVSLPPRSS